MMPYATLIHYAAPFSRRRHICFRAAALRAIRCRAIAADAAMPLR